MRATRPMAGFTGNTRCGIFRSEPAAGRGGSGGMAGKTFLRGRRVLHCTESVHNGFRAFLFMASGDVKPGNRGVVAHLTFEELAASLIHVRLPFVGNPKSPQKGG